MKPAHSSTSFDWHRDDAKQLEKVGGVESTEAFCSTWAPLDDCTLNSGTLELKSKKTDASQVIECEPGDVVVFAKDAWHRSSANASDGDRSVHYAQFSPTPVLLDARPLWFAVPCEPTRESVDERGAEPTRRHSCRASCATLSRNRGRCPMKRVNSRARCSGRRKENSASTARATPMHY